MLTDKELFILDIIVNFGSTRRHRLSRSWINSNLKLEEYEVNVLLNKLKELGLILFDKDESGYEIIKIAPEKQNEVLNLLENYWGEHKVREQIRIFENNLSECIKILETKISIENQIYISFYDNYYDDEGKLYNFCQRLLDARLVFKEIWSSNRYLYEDFYLRKVPVNVLEELSNYVSEEKSKINTDDFKPELEWRILLLPMLFYSINVEDIVAIFPNLTRDEVLELLKELESRGILTISVRRRQVSVPQLMKDILWENFGKKGYPAFESYLINLLKEKIKQSILNLYKLGIIRKLLLNSVVKYEGPFAVVEGSSIKDVNVEDLKEISKFGLVFLVKDKVIIANKVLERLEEIIESKLSEEVIRIPANNTYLAHNAFRDIFSGCEEYIKIQDEYVNEETLRILESYAPTGINITVLTSIEGSRDLDIEEMKKIVNRIKSSGRKLRLLFIGKDSGEAPFHFRYIISKDLCYSFSTSIKQVGKSKDTDIIKISKEEKEGKIEPAFDYWVELPKEKLKEKGIQRLEFNEWVSQKMIKNEDKSIIE